MKLHKIIIIGFLPVAFAGGFWLFISKNNGRLTKDVHPEVWTKNGYDGPSFEFKVNCALNFNYDVLEACFLWDLNRVVVQNPEGKQYDLNKDFNVNRYSGEITRRWVLYGESNAGFPAPGQYEFRYYRNDSLVLTQTVSYQPEIVDYPKNVIWQRAGRDIFVTWEPPAGVKRGMWYKVILFPEKGSIVSQTFSWDARSARLPDLPLADGERTELNVALYFSGGYAYPKNIVLNW